MPVCRLRDRTSQAKNSTKWQRLINLKELYDEGFITLEEYKERKLQLVDELTGAFTEQLPACGIAQELKRTDADESLASEYNPSLVAERTTVTSGRRSASCSAWRVQYIWTHA